MATRSLLLLAAVLLCASALVVEAKSRKCPDGSAPVNCLVDPCTLADCGPEKDCVSNYCGGCNAVCWKRIKGRRNPCADKLCRPGYFCKAEGRRAKCISQCARKHCRRGYTCKLVDGQAECVSRCATKRCRNGYECKLTKSGTPRCVKVARPEPVDPCIFTTCLVGTFCQADGDTANCITNCATVRCAAGTRCETDPDTGNASCVPDV